ncbi:VanZ family protein [Promicromonospora iranensis]|uniref:VanZ-like domain-containing protein n=1 Tax=Promicromonospora iranensis TaxID=1105144 RepID=A0ABU2CJ31_9MICO|nr:VanZ family protein [Promicromonospora iranensis]MDR7381340.1 hypothetical protein [Promicromonospora iranensis]
MTAGVWGEWGHVVRPALLCLLAAVLAIRVLVRLRTLRGVPRQRAWRHSVAEVGMVVGTAPWVWMILTPRPRDSSLSLVPFRDLADQLGGPVAGAVVQVGGNLLVLAALGFFLPIRFRLAPDAGHRTAAVLARVALLAAGISVTVEVLQLALGLGRVSSVDDVLVNTAGAVLAALCSRRWWPQVAGP